MTTAAYRPNRFPIDLVLMAVLVVVTFTALVIFRP